MKQKKLGEGGRVNEGRGLVLRTGGGEEEVGGRRGGGNPVSDVRLACQDGPFDVEVYPSLSHSQKPALEG